MQLAPPLPTQNKNNNRNTLNFPCPLKLSVMLLLGLFSLGCVFLMEGQGLVFVYLQSAMSTHWSLEITDNKRNSGSWQPHLTAFLH